MTTADDEFLDAFLQEQGGADVLAALASISPAQQASPGLRERVLGAARVGGRLSRFSGVVSDLLDLPAPAAQALLDRLTDESAWSPGLVPRMELLHVEGGPRVKGAITGFVRLGSGVSFPEHEHLGDEEVLILQGSCVDSIDHRVSRAGDRVRMPCGTVHSFSVREGPDLVYLAVVGTGLRVNGQELLAHDLRL